MIMMTIVELNKAQKEIHEEILKYAIEKNLVKDDLKPMYDGVCDVAKYLGSSPRIMWVLKEFSDETTNEIPSGGGYCVYDCFSRDDAWKVRSWQRMIYTSYGIANHCRWNDMDWIRNNKSMVAILNQIAYINVSKMPGLIKSDDNNIRRCYSIWRTILLKQIQLYNPNIIIFGSTLKFFWNDPGFKEIMPGITNEPIIKKDRYLDVYKSNEVLLFDAYHPSIWKNECIDSIIDICLDYDI